jgi:mannose-6-phosphate isomerase
MPALEGLRLTPAYRERVWGGQRLRQASPPIGEAWIVYEHNQVTDGPHAGRTLADLTAEYGEALLGRLPLARTGDRFPLLIKLLDTADWLSVQVHPNDEQAVQLEGPGHFGKTEAWHILEAAPGAEVICGLQPGTTRDALADAIRDGTVTDLARHLAVAAGDTIFIGAGTIHALGPDLLLYEVQQTSDITYRVFDWNRPQSAGRALHIAQSLAVADPAIVGEAQPHPTSGPTATLFTCPYFTLEQLAGQAAPLVLDTAGASCHALTVAEGTAQIAGAGWSHDLARFETVVVPASCGVYQVRLGENGRVLKSSVA